jgi:hypothetical protein
VVDTAVTIMENFFDDDESAAVMREID